MKTVILAAMAMLLPFLAASQNLIVNPGAETLPVIGNGWTLVTGNITAAGCGANPPCQEGSHLFYANAFANSECYQIVDVSAYATTIDNGTQQFDFVDYIRSFPQTPADAGRAIVEYRNGSGTILTSYDSGYQSNTSAWIPLSDTRFAPVGTRSIKVRLLSKRNNGTNNDAYHDDLSLIALEVLPVELTDFQGFVQADAIALTWETASEVGNNFFEIEKSRDGRQWIEVGSMDGKGISNIATIYHFKDERPFPGVNYYRLRQVDFDGKEIFSKVIDIEFVNEGGKLVVFPNPATEFIILKNADVGDFEKLEIFGSGGNVIFTTIEEISTLKIGTWEPGLYHLRMIGERGVQSSCFLKK
ncbi:MAG: T9SS type A sorting domain-containing protein [Saprospiraceae bacterium]|nr:T9SS type A sorting domain-containing protein [Saprospiraceae bacterium]